jgi:hypothetical protein
MGVPVANQSRLIDTLRDYMDPDTLRRLNGAEAAEYVAKGRAPPANDYPRTRDELPNVLAWDDLFATIEAAAGRERAMQFLSLFTAARHTGININTAPADVLLALEGIDPTRVAALIDQRKARPFANINELAPYANGRIDDEVAMLVGTNTWRVTHQKAGMPFLLECQIALTAGAPDKPAKTSACRRRPLALRESVPSGEFARAITTSFGGSALDIARINNASARRSTTSLGLTTNSRGLNNSTNTSGPISFDHDASTLPWLTSALSAQP